MNDHKVSVMMVVTSFFPSPMGGSELQAFRLAGELKKRGLNPYIVALGIDDQKEEDEVDGIKVYRIHSFFNPARFSRKSTTKKGPVRIEYQLNDKANFIPSQKKSLFSFLFYFSFLFKVYFLARKKKQPLDLIYIPIMEWTAFIGTLLGWLLKKKVVVKDSTANGIIALLRYPFGKSIQKFVTKHAYFVAMTREIRKNFISAGVEEKRIFPIPNGVSYPKDPVRSIDPDKFVFVGNLTQQPAKGIDILLRAWKSVIASHPSAKLYVIGAGNVPEYYDYVKSLGIADNVIFMGKQAEFTNHLLEATAFILPSRREGMSNSLLEAMSLGVPCIATDISGSQDLIDHERNGLLVPVEDEVLLAKAVDYFYNHPEKNKSMGIEARKTIEQGYTLSHVSERYADLFRTLVKQ
jgi:glycosyltransferase involved in cell wall biosynthesis